jgi:hypothetical protein
MLPLSTEELCVLSILLEEEEEENIQNSEKRKRKRFSVHKMLNKRNQKENTGLYTENQWMMKKSFSIFSFISISI